MEYPGYLESEVSIVWREPRERFPFLREVMLLDMDPAESPPLDYYGSPGTRIIAFAVCDPQKRDAQRARRIWYIRESDVTYRPGHAPWQGVDPATIHAGRQTT